MPPRQRLPVQQIAGLLCALLWLAFGSPLRAAGPPSPPVPRTPITDNAPTFNKFYLESTAEEIRRWELATHHPVVIWTEKTLGGVDPDAWCRETFERWRIERPNLDDGAAIFIVVDEEVLHFEAGPRLLAELPADAPEKMSRVIEDVRAMEKDPSDWKNPIVWNIYALSYLQKWIGRIPPEPPPSFVVEENEHAHDNFWERRAAEFERDPGIIGLLAIMIVIFVFLLVTHPALTLSMVFFNVAGGILGEASSGLGRAAGSIFNAAGGSFGGGGASGKW